MSENPLEDKPDERLVRAANDRGAIPGEAVVAEMMRRLKDAMAKSEESANTLGQRISSLTVWLLIFTIVICGLTDVLVLAELGLLKRGAH